MEIMVGFRLFSTPKTMKSKKQQQAPLRILLDEESFISNRSKLLLNLKDNEVFEFISLSEPYTHTKAQLLFDEAQDLSEIIIDKSNISGECHIEHIGFGYRKDDMQYFSKTYQIEYEKLLLLFVLSAISQSYFSGKTILVSENTKILHLLDNNGNQFLSLPPHSIFDPKEALIYLDLLYKSKDIYLASANYSVGSFLWYLYALKTKVPNFQSVWSIVTYGKDIIPEVDLLTDFIESLGDRITEMLMAIDEIGMNYYFGSGNSAQNKIIYHFNYWIGLYTGVLDSLAWIIKYRFQLEFSDCKKIGLRKKENAEFLISVFNLDPRIKNMIDAYQLMICLIYKPRNLITHKERLQGIRYTDTSKNMELNMFRIPAEFFFRIRDLSKENGKILGTWGHFTSHKCYYLEPYRFTRKATTALISFVDAFLPSLNFDEYRNLYPLLREKMESKDAKDAQCKFKRELEHFEKNSFGS